jgi:hypothetical protein
MPAELPSSLTLISQGLFKDVSSGRVACGNDGEPCMDGQDSAYFKQGAVCLPGHVCAKPSAQDSASVDPTSQGGCSEKVSYTTIVPSWCSPFLFIRNEHVSHGFQVVYLLLRLSAMSNAQNGWAPLGALQCEDLSCGTF